MPIPAVIAALVSQGLGLTANAVLARGAEWLKETTGIDLDLDGPDPKLTPEQLTIIRQRELENELELRKLTLEEQKLDLQTMQLIAEVEKTEQQEVTKRWQSDMGSDSWLSKNVRPMVLVYLLTAYTAFSLMSVWQMNVNQTFVELLAQWGMIVMTAYFGGRSAEKIVELWTKRKGNSK